MQPEVKTIASSGQISLGKQYAGRTVTVEQIAEGVRSIKTAQVIPDDELWLHTPEMRAGLDRRNGRPLIPVPKRTSVPQRQNTA